jgi:hypothetical protein
MIHSYNFNEIVLHIGAEKTGTTSIQEFLYVNRERFRAKGVFFPESVGVKNNTRLTLLAANDDRPIVLKALNNYSKFKSIEDFRHTIRNEFARELTAAINDRINEPVTKLLFSGEHMHSQLQTQQELLRLKNLLPNTCRVRVIFYVRRQDKAALSLHSTGLKANSSNSKFSYPSNLPYRFDYFRAYKLWSSVFGDDAVQVCIFDPKKFSGTELLKDFCLSAGVAWCDNFEITPTKNESLDANGEFIFGIFNKLHAAGDERYRRKDYKALKEVIASTFSRSINYKPARADAQAFYKLFQQSNNNLLAAAFIGRNQPLFDDDFGDYPIEARELSQLVDSDEIITELLKAWLDLHIKKIN